MAEFSLRSEQAAVSVTEHASEITSFKDNATGIEYMWQGDPAFWAGRNPTLFPMVGSTWDKILHINGKEYVTGNHGFTRRSDFTCIGHTDRKIVMELKESEATLKEYPFRFTMHITYELEGRTLSIRYEIKNENDEVMPFNFGLHPAFNCPVVPGKDFFGCHLEMNAPELVDGREVTRIDLDRDRLLQTIIITDPKSTESVLTDGEHGVRVGYTGYEWLAFWSAKNAPFVCIEPWHSHTDFDKVEVPFEEREGTTILEAGGTFVTEYTITIF